MRLRRIVAALLLSAAALGAQERCGVAKDMVVRVREMLAQGGTDLENSLQLLKQATQICYGQGDAWYYRSLFERKLGHTQAADMALGNARLFGSEALSLGIDPFAREAAPSAAPPAAGTVGEVRSKWALLVGISAFRDQRIPKLRYTAKDATDMAAELTGPDGRFQADHVRLITDKDATTVNIKTGLNWLARSAAPDDLAVVYVSSHGSPREMDTAGVSYVVTYDSDITSPDTLYATSLPMVDLAEAVQTRIRARRTVVFLDTCFSGAAIAGGQMSGGKDLKVESEGMGVSGDMVSRFRQGTGRVIVTSSSAREKSWEGDTFANGVFTHFLLEALQLKDGLLPVEDVFQYVHDHVVDTVRKRNGVSQVPTLARSDSGTSIIIGAPGTAR